MGQTSEFAASLLIVRQAASVKCNNALSNCQLPNSIKTNLVIYFTPVAIARINNSLYHPFVSLTRDTEDTEKTCLSFEFLCALCASVVKGFL